MGIKLQLTEFLESYNPKYGEFEGFKVVLEYTNCIQEHKLTRTLATIADISHLRVYCLNSEALSKIDYLTPFKTDFSLWNSSQYLILLNDSGGIVEDGMLYLSNNIYFVGNACNKDVLPKYFEYHQVEFKIIQPVVLVIQGPHANVLMKNLGLPCPSSKNSVEPLSNDILFISQTGYSGELSYEIFLHSVDLAKDIIRKTISYGYHLCGLIARDTLRLEAGLTLYGNELSESFSPLESGLASKVDFSKEFIGKHKMSKNWDLRLFILEEFGGVPRKGLEVVDISGGTVGFVTSGYKTPCLKLPIGFCRIKRTDNDLFINIRDKKCKIKLITKQTLKKQINCF